MSETIVIGGEEVTHAQKMCGNSYREEVRRYHAALARYEERKRSHPRDTERYLRIKKRCEKRGEVLTTRMPVLPSEPVFPKPEFICHGLRLSLCDTPEGERWVSECGRFIINYCSTYEVNTRNCTELVFDIRVGVDPRRATKDSPLHVYIVGSEYASKAESRGVPRFWTPAGEMSTNGSKKKRGKLVGAVER